MSFLAVLDPAWSTDSGGGGRGAQNHYGLDDVQGMAWQYRQSPCWRDDETALVWIWSTVLALHGGHLHALASALDVRVCAGFVWAKVDVYENQNPVHIPAMMYSPPRRHGLGQWSRCEHEHLFLCRRGSVHVPSTSARPRSVIYAPRSKHSEKPEAAWKQVVEPISRDVLPGVVGVEFNCRRRRPGWAAFGRLDGEDAPLRYEAHVDDVAAEVRL